MQLPAAAEGAIAPDCSPTMPFDIAQRHAAAGPPLECRQHRGAAAGSTATRCGRSVENAELPDDERIAAAEVVGAVRSRQRRPSARKSCETITPQTPLPLLDGAAASGRPRAAPRSLPTSWSRLYGNALAARPAGGARPVLEQPETTSALLDAFAENSSTWPR